MRKKEKAIVRILGLIMAVCLLLQGMIPVAAQDGAAQAESFSDSPQINWQMEFSEDNTKILDASGHDRAAEICGRVTPEVGPQGQGAIRLSGEAGYLRLESPEFDFSGDFSVSALFKVDAVDGKEHLVVGKNVFAQNKREWELFVTTKNTIAFYLRLANGQWFQLDSGVTTQADRWYDAVVAVEKNLVTLFLDGKLAAAGMITKDRFAPTDAPITVGATWNGGALAGQFAGVISEVKIADRGLQHETLRFSTEHSVSVENFETGAQVFSDRSNYFVSEKVPEAFRAMQFIFEPIGGGSFRAKNSGVLYALTPSKDRAGTSPQETELAAMGFMRMTTNIDPDYEVQTFGERAVDRSRIYVKSVVEGETITVGKWALLMCPSLEVKKTDSYLDSWANNNGERLYNGIVLPEEWPPKVMDRYGSEALPVPYLDCPPETIDIRVGRQLFVDDFLIESTDMGRTYHKAEKYEGNPVMTPETALEKGLNGHAAMAAPFSDGVWYDGEAGLFKMWYHAGWFDGTALATSKDGIHWERPTLDIVKGTNRVLPIRSGLERDGSAVIYDPYTEDDSARYKMLLYSRPIGGELYTSPDGIHWSEPTTIADIGDRSTIYYNPFRECWVYSIRSGWYARSRDYAESEDFLAGASLENRVHWLRADRYDIADPVIRVQPELYNFDAVAYESIMLGAFDIFLGPQNETCAATGTPKITEIHLGYSRDGFHWYRPTEDRTAFIGATQQEGSWERGYVHSNAALCQINDDELWFYYTAFAGDESRKNLGTNANGMYANASTGLARLRRDGFASMDAEGLSTLTTRPLTFDGKYLFVNVDAPEGALRAEVLDENGNPIEGFTADDCTVIRADSTKTMVSWGEKNDLSALAGKRVKLRFIMENGSLYSFWVSENEKGTSNGYLAGGSVGQVGLVDTLASYDAPAHGGGEGSGEEGGNGSGGNAPTGDRIVLWAMIPTSLLAAGGFAWGLQLRRKKKKA